ncbi:MAG: nicotinamide mononucleotide transporter [Ruminococcaceae bacterium]|nr:nicotinamide mononucleotide transporter [Oscillospiraceae bacterium]
MKKLFSYFTKFELILWICSVAVVIVSYVGFSRTIDLAFFASLIGATSLILNAKGNPLGMGLMIFFCMIYGYISYTFSYYGEMITYLGMSWPMAIMAFVSWIRNPYKNKRSQVTISHVTKKDLAVIFICAVAVTVVLYFVLKFFGTANLLISTFSVLTSFIAAALTFKRSPYFALAYAINDIVLIVMWILATLKDTYYLSVVICFAMFLVNDSYSFINWKRMQRKQAKGE